ncbi:MAG: hypothetical protein DRI93_01290 [Aquificota bacterium]|nr:MAG: hypothetical protein DRI93_01290 [Aquificota bacterium]
MGDVQKDLFVLVEALRLLFTGEDLEDSLAKAVPLLKDFLKADFMSFFLWKEKERVLVPVVVEGRPLETLPSRITLGEGITGRVAEGKRALWVEDCRKDPRVHPQCRHWAASLMSSPLFVEDRLYGVLTVARTKGKREFTTEEFRIFQELARYLSGFLELDRLLEDGYHAFALAVEAREPGFKGHSLAVARISMDLARKAGMDCGERKMLYWVALLHDVGKVGVPDVTLVKPLPLDKREKLVVSLHSQLGAALISLVEPLKGAVPWVLHHHERWDGKGYPSGLEGEEIPLASRIIHLAESFHAMVLSLPYGEALSRERVKKELLSGRGRQWDPHLVDLFLGDFDRYWAILHECMESPYPKELEEVHSEVTHILFSIEILKDLSSLIVSMSHASVVASIQAVLERLALHLGWQGVSLLDEHGRVLATVNTGDKLLEPSSEEKGEILEIRWGGYTYFLKVKGRVSSQEKQILETLEGFLASLIGLLFHGEGKILRDELTGSYTLSSIKEFFSSVAPQVQRMAVVLLDLDGFKEVNDRFGHEMGNKVLQRLVSVIEENLRDSDLMGRYGGDEFVILLPRVDKKEADRIIGRIRRTVEDAVLVKGVPPVTFSFGVALFPDEGKDVCGLLKLADRRMYREKALRKEKMKRELRKGALKLGQSCALTGSSAFLGQEYRKGLELGFRWGEERYGERVELVTLDDRYEPDLCALNTEKLLKEDGVFALVGYVGTPTSAVVAPLAERSGIPFIFPLSGALFLRWPTKRWIFNLRPSYHQEVEAMIRGLVEEMGVEEVGIFYQDDTYGWEVLGAAESTLLRYKLEIKGKGSYKRNSLQVEEACLALLKERPQVVIMAGTWEPCAIFVKRVKEEGWAPLFLAISYVGGEAFARGAGEAGEGTVVAQVVPHPQSSLPIVQELRKALKEEEPTHVCLEGFLGAVLLVEALKDMEEVGRESLVRSLEAMKEMDLGGLRLHLSDHDHQAFSSVHFTVVRKGRLVPFQGFSELASQSLPS